MFSIKNGDDNDSGIRRKNAKISFPWTNYNTFLKALQLIFVNLWDNKKHL